MREYRELLQIFRFYAVRIHPYQRLQVISARKDFMTGAQKMSEARKDANRVEQEGCYGDREELRVEISVALGAGLHAQDQLSVELRAVKEGERVLSEEEVSPAHEEVSCRLHADRVLQNLVPRHAIENGHAEVVPPSHVPNLGSNRVSGLLDHLPMSLVRVHLEQLKLLPQSLFSLVLFPLLLLHLLLLLSAAPVRNFAHRANHRSHVCPARSEPPHASLVHRRVVRLERTILTAVSARGNFHLRFRRIFFGCRRCRLRRCPLSCTLLPSDRFVACARE
mmetsp:Transcript_1105/g.4109  ORF Transcript_1105/g.4109 Transcript_1105/m.4109 type:complete len:279 (+) Transcript_1105:1612-2448(+)